LIGGGDIALVMSRAAAPFATWAVIHHLKCKIPDIRESVQNRIQFKLN
jgi:hypothetical protein